MAKKKIKERAETTGYLFGLLGESIGIDIVPFLTGLEHDKDVKKSMSKGRKQVYKKKK